MSSVRWPISDSGRNSTTYLDSERPTLITPKHVFDGRVAGRGVETSPPTPFYPTNGAEIDAALRDRIIRKTLKRIARQAARRAFASYLLLQFQCLLLQIRRAMLRLLSRVFCTALKFFAD
jgi:hypothetical protein